MTEFSKDKYLKNVSPVNSINSKMDLIESLLVKVDGTPSGHAELIFEYLDEIQAEVDTFQAGEIEKTKIESQLNYITNQLYSSAKIMLRSIGGVEKLKELRKKKMIPSTHWWWYLDQYIIEKRKSKFRKMGILGLLAITIGALIVIAYYQFFAPPPEVRARIELEGKIDDLIDSGEYSAAMKEIEPALNLTPDYFPLWIKKGVLAKVMGEEDTAQASFEEAIELSSDPEYFFSERANIYLQFGMYDEVLVDAAQLMEISPDIAEAYLYRGLVFETRGQIQDAVDEYEKAMVLAEEQNNSQLAATIKVRMGMMLQFISIPTTEQ